MLVDGFGSPKFSDAFLAALTQAGVRLRSFDPRRPVLGMRLHVFRRMHRKLLVVDGALAFVGGINYSADHLADFGPEAKQDYSVEMRGPVVAEVHRFAHANLDVGSRHDHALRRLWRWRRGLRHRPDELPKVGTARAMLVSRDNAFHTNDIERQYRVAIRSARERIVIANAYFLSLIHI